MAKGTTVQQLRERSDADLADFVRGKQKDLLDTRFKNYTNQPMDTSSVAKPRQETAPGLTGQTGRLKVKQGGA